VEAIEDRKGRKQQTIAGSRIRLHGGKLFAVAADGGSFESTAGDYVDQSKTDSLQDNIQLWQVRHRELLCLEAIGYCNWM
jgi:hypothetical protein